MFRKQDWLFPKVANQNIQAQNKDAEGRVIDAQGHLEDAKAKHAANANEMLVTSLKFGSPCPRFVSKKSARLITVCNFPQTGRLVS